MINNNAMNLHSVNTPYRSLMCGFITVTSYFITLHNQLGRYVEWLYFPMIYTRLALGPAEHK
jgi:hypothetical protein